MTYSPSLRGIGGAVLRLFVNFSPMAHLDHKDDQAIILNLINHAIMSNANSPLNTSLELARTLWPRLISKRFHSFDDSFRGLSIDSLELFPCSACKDDAICQGAVSPQRVSPVPLARGKIRPPSSLDKADIEPCGGLGLARIRGDEQRSSCGEGSAQMECVECPDGRTLDGLDVSGLLALRQYGRRERHTFKPWSSESSSHSVSHTCERWPK